jgi:2-alkyl-3-oxoalkanoate reductase
VALTGATGFVGGATLRRLLNKGFQVKALVRPGRSLPAQQGLECISGSLDDRNSLEHLVSDSNAVIHVAGAISGRTYADFARTNAAGCTRLVDAIRKYRRQARLIHVSSLAARAPELSDYAASKRAGEEVIATSQLDWQIIRPPAVYGPEDPALAPFWRLLARGWLPRIGQPTARFSLIHVEDLSAALVTLATANYSESATTCLHDGKINGYDWSEIAAIAAATRGKRVRIVPVPAALLTSAGYFNLIWSSMRRVRPPVLVPGKVPELAHPNWVCDNTQLPGCPNWKPSMQFKDCLTDLPGWSRYR